MCIRDRFNATESSNAQVTVPFTQQTYHQENEYHFFQPYNPEDSQRPTPQSKLGK